MLKTLKDFFHKRTGGEQSVMVIGALIAIFVAGLLFGQVIGVAVG